MEIKFVTCDIPNFTLWDYLTWFTFAVLIILIYFHLYWIAILPYAFIFFAGTKSRKLSNPRIFGEIVFDNSQCITKIQGDTQMIDYNSILKIRIIFNAMKGEMLAIKSLPSRGCDNRVIMWTQGGKTTFKILCEDEQDFFRLRILYRFLESKGIVVTQDGL